MGTASSVAAAYTKLFVKESKASKKSGKKRWGEGPVKITGAKVSGDENLTVDIHIKSSADIEEPIVGFRIKNAAGQELLGTNTRIEKKPVKSLTKGEKTTVSFTFANSFNDGDYVVDCAVLHKDALTISEWWEGSANFVVTRDLNTPFVIQPAYKTSISKD